MGKRVDQMNMSEVRSEIAKVEREAERNSYQHENCGTSRDDGPCGHFGRSFANGIYLSNLYERQARLDSSCSPSYDQDDSDWHD